ncbi:hypothetical protein EXM22_02365 [Oceanispirochaeta crateris]|uniref:Uncharacterized protein n=1 Tax=Oceanispirochaeta crateris TaxID=2518645 RepID=A0A5C1QL58_9SPIO|nr:hypothetical protein [Oceanispirochaeta crateris]QEN06892.1 hypothetical protein EXM22_02365 [Oceanispirochaeta crateris]
MRKKIVPVLIRLLFLPMLSLSAESQILSDMELFNSVYRGSDDWYYAGSGNASVTIRSPRDPHVLGQTELEFYPVDIKNTASTGMTTLYVKKAYIRTRMPGFKLTMGKTRLAWGQGSVFNAGDVIFASLNPVLDLSQSELRSDTAWLTSVNIPLGNFSFIEAVALPPALDAETGSIGGLNRSSIGGRGYFLAKGIKFEGGYLYKGETKGTGDRLGHHPYISLQGNWGPDWYLASSLAVPTEAQKENDAISDNWKESWIISFGLYHKQEINRNHTIDFRLETLWFPYQNWEDREQRDTIYGVYFYPEILWASSSSTFFSLQSVLSPLDASSMITGGAGWNIYQGLTLLAYCTFYLGNETSTFSWDRKDLWEADRDGIQGFSMMTGLRYSF